ncbi:YceI family protein [Arenibacterium sp. CAU 1754]
MANMNRRTTLTALASLALCPTALAAARTRYTLDTRASQVGFRFILNGAQQKGTMPVRSADIRIAPDDLAASQVDVSVNVAGARTPFIFATKALIGPDVLDAARFPVIRFVSERVELASDGRLSGGARLHGRLTLRGNTRPITLDANLYRPQGTDPNDLSQLQIRLSGQVSRSAFGASGYANLVADRVDLDISAVIRAA